MRLVPGLWREAVVWLLCRKAVEQWGGHLSEITHVVSTTCTNSANPGYDHYVVKELGLNTSIEKVLLHGVGCSGGLAALRTAANIALGSSFRPEAGSNPGIGLRDLQRSGEKRAGQYLQERGSAGLALRSSVTALRQ